MQIMPTLKDATIPVAGDMSKTPGTWVRQILAKPEESKYKYAMVATNTLTMGRILDLWSKMTALKGYYMEFSKKAYKDVWGVGDAEQCDLLFGELVPDWMDFTTAQLWMSWVLHLKSRAAKKLLRASRRSCKSQ